MWVHNDCSLISESHFKSVKNTNYTWICPKCDPFNFSDSFFTDQLNLGDQNRFEPLQRMVELELLKLGQVKISLSMD